MTSFNIASPGDLHRRLAKYIANISQWHNEYVSLSMLLWLKTCFTRNCHEWCVSELLPLVIYSRKFKSISMYGFGTSTMHLELGNLFLNIERRMNKIKGAWPYWTIPSDCECYLPINTGRQANDKMRDISVRGTKTRCTKIRCLKHKPYQIQSSIRILCIHTTGHITVQPVDRLNIKTWSYQYRNNHYEDKTVSRPSYLHNGNPISGKAILYWDGAWWPLLGWLFLYPIILAKSLHRIWRSYTRKWKEQWAAHSRVHTVVLVLKLGHRDSPSNGYQVDIPCHLPGTIHCLVVVCSPRSIVKLFSISCAQRTGP